MGGGYSVSRRVSFLPVWTPLARTRLVAEFPVARIAGCFHDLVDPRMERTKRHDLLDIVTLALFAVLAGAESWVEVAEWGEIKLPWLRTWLALPNGIPSHDTFGR